MGFTPYEIMYGRPPTLLHYVLKTAKVQSVKDYLYDWDHVKKLLLENLVKARDRMMSYADRRRTERQFEVGDWVLLKLQLYRQTSARGVLPQKLSSKYYVPYLILEKIGTVAYCLQLSSSAKIHDVFHFS